jgi:hypothetical protein
MRELKDGSERLSPTHPYPLRPSELVRTTDIFADIETLQLTESEKEALFEFEKPLFERTKKLKKISVSSHVVYPEAFVSEEGRRLFSATYFDIGLEERVEDLVETTGVKLEETKDKRKVHDAFFDDLLEIVASEERYGDYRGSGAEFPELTGVVRELEGNLEKDIILSAELPRTGEVSKEDITRLFLGVDLSNIPSQVRKRLNNYSSDWAKDKFKQEFFRARGDIATVSNPERMTKIEDVEKLTEKLVGLRDFKSDLKKLRQKLDGQKDALSEAKGTVIDLYQRYVNVLIAGQYARGRVLAQQPTRSKREEHALALIRGVKQDTDKDRFGEGRASRTIERIDHFLKGTGVEIDENGLFQTIPDRLAEYAQTRISTAPPEETAEYKKYNAIRMNAEQTKALGDVVIDICGFGEKGSGWSAVVVHRKGTVAVVYKEKGEKVREVRISTSFNRGLIDTLTVLAHEIEGHVLRYVNQEESQTTGLQFAEEALLGRSAILSEAASMKVEQSTKQALVGMERETLPYYYLGLVQKRKGASFKECFKEFMKARAGRKYGFSLDSLLEDKKIYDEAFEYVYPRTLRIFRRHTPLDDRSGYLPTSWPLEYIEQELIVDVFSSESAIKSGFSKLLYLAGIDLYSLQDLRRLGMLDLSEVKEPEMVIADKVWPVLKENLDTGLDLNEAVERLQERL